MKTNNKFRNILFFLNIFSIISLFLIISCKTSPKSEKNSIPEPQWITDKKGAFPDSEYLSQLGTGESATEAWNNSIAQLANYFNTNVKSLVEGDTFLINEPDGQTRTTRTIQSSVVTKTDLELFALETAEPYYLEREKKWYCCAYINRKDTWNQYEPLVRDQKNAFYSIYNLAEKENEPLEKIKIYTKAQDQSELFMACLYRATMFSKPFTDKAFGSDRALIASIPGLIQKQKNNCVFYIAAKDDFASTVSSCINKIFSGMGYTVSDSKEKAYYIVDSAISYNEIVQDDLIVYYPSVKVNIKSLEKSLYVYENKCNKIMSYNQAKAKKAACDSIAELLNKELADDFNSTIGLGK